MNLSFHGATRTVTGSCHLLGCNGRRILVDCGLFQGGRELREENEAAFGFDAGSIDIVLLTHAHLDHCGRLPLLARRGFRGEVVATPATFELARLVILDSVHLQLEDARHHGHRDGGHRDGDHRDGNHRDGRRRDDRHHEDVLYSMVDAMEAIGRFGRAAAYRKPFELAPGIRATFFDAGHILGSASILLEAQEHGRRRSFLFSGDIGNVGRPLSRRPETPASADVVVMEATYGDRRHRPYAASVDELYEAIDATLVRGGNVLIPTFALERTQEILYALHQAIARRRLPRGLPVFLDSPMAVSATEIFRKHPDAWPTEIGPVFAGGNDPFDLPNLTVARETSDSMAINRISGGAVILAGSGMCTGGRIVHHLRHNLGNEKASVIFVGFAAQGTPARHIIDGAKTVRLLGEDIAVRAHVHTINGFSAHADQPELLAWHNGIAGVRQTFVVHAETSVMTAFAERLGTANLHIPELHARFEV
ncbi:MAG: MBL fold metallo-hydrolase [Proteobacteria bacterium]|nr:MBL fold metallo-hydrolase [Pseudomonadota bacterium]